MMRFLIGTFVVAAVTGCSHREGNSPDAPASDADLTARCSTGHADKIKFDRQTSCANDGSVEFCVPDNDPGVLSTLTTVSPTISCAPGGGRANCGASPGLLLCFYPTAFPTACVTEKGAMTAETWLDMCEISGIAQVSEIVQTLFE